MGYWDILSILEEGDKWWTAKELVSQVKTSYNNVNKHLRKLVKLGYIISEEAINYIGNYHLPYKKYKAFKFFMKKEKE